MHPQAIMNLAVFDVDGTLLNNLSCEDACYAQALRDVLRISALDTDWARYEHVSDAGVAVEAFRRQFDSDPTPEQVEATISHFLDLLAAAHRATPGSIQPVAGARHILRALADRGWAVAIATGAWRRAAEFKLSVAGVTHSGIPMATSEDGPARTAIIANARSQAERLHGIDAFDRVVSIGDGAWDIRAARALAIPFVGLAPGPRAERLRSAGASIVLEDFSDVGSTVTALETASIPLTSV